MTLRVTVEIVPFGEEKEKRTIGVANISNIGGKDVCNYVYNYKDNDGTVVEGTIYNHDRSDGALELIHRVITSITNQI